MSAPGNNLPCILYVDRMLRTRGLSKVLQDSKGIQILTICLISKGLLFFYTPCRSPINYDKCEPGLKQCCISLKQCCISLKQCCISFFWSVLLLITRLNRLLLNMQTFWGVSPSPPVPKGWKLAILKTFYSNFGNTLLNLKSGEKFSVLTLSYVNTALSQSASRIYKCYIIIKFNTSDKKT